MKYLLPSLLFCCSIIIFSFNQTNSISYKTHYYKQINSFIETQQTLLTTIARTKELSELNTNSIKQDLNNTRQELKKVDFWLRYLAPVQYKKINSPLPVEWETEVFEKHEKPYQKIGAGLTLALLYMEESKPNKDTLIALLQPSLEATSIFLHDSITTKIKSFDHFYFCNRLFLLNLASIYTTGFECPDTNNIIPELEIMLNAVNDIYTAYNESFPNQTLLHEYLSLYQSTLDFVKTQPKKYSHFNHFKFIQEYVNPLFSINQQLITLHQAYSKSNLDYSLNKSATSIFDKDLYLGQNTKGIFIRVQDPKALAEIEKLGKLLFYDPILSGNNQRSCASCHDPNQYFTDTSKTTSFQYNRKDFLERNSPSLLNAPYQHLAMYDGRHYTLQHQAKAVITDPIEMGSSENELINKIMSCGIYKNGFKKLLRYTPQEPTLSLEHIVSAITYYYGKFSDYEAPFDVAMNQKSVLDKNILLGFNLFMSKAQCATCHFVPQFNGVKPPYVGSEFEVLGTPEDKLYQQLSDDNGRYNFNKAKETFKAFRTGTIRNTSKTKPYMHNGVFTTIDEVIEFYNGGGGAGRGLNISNQTLSSDSLHLSDLEKKQLKAFIESLNENIRFEHRPNQLPASSIRSLNTRKVGGEY